MNKEIQIYWPNGSLKRSLQMKDSKRSGYDRMWSKEGVLVDESFYEEGKPCKTHRRFNDKGSLIEEVNYHEPHRFSYTIYNETGSLVHQWQWLDERFFVEKFWDESLHSFVEKKGEFLAGKVVYEVQNQISLDKVFQMDRSVQNSSRSRFLEKNPHLLFLLPQQTSKEFTMECLPSFDVGNANVLFVYGLKGFGAFYQLQTWLQINSHKLVFLEDDIEIIGNFIDSSQSESIIEHPQVFIEYVSSIDLIAEKYPVRFFEIVKAPSKDEAEFNKLKLLLFRKLTLSFAILQDRLHGYQILENFLKNAQHISGSFFANRLKNAFEGRTAIVCGAGPSLDFDIEILKEISSKALIIAGGSTIAALSAKGVPIHFSMAIDPNLEEYRRLKNSLAFQTPFLYSTRVHPDVFRTTDGPFGYMRSGIGGVLELWLEEELGLEDPFIGEKLSPETVSVTGICLAFAEYIGCKEIYLSGVDLAYTGNRRYANEVVFEPNCCVEDLDKEKGGSDRIVETKDFFGNRLFTATRWIMEANSISFFGKEHPSVVIQNTTKFGLPIEGVEFISILDVKNKLEQKTLLSQKLILEKIQPAFFDQTMEEKLSRSLQSLIQSLNQVIECLEIIVGEKEGSKVLAELDLKQELAYDIFFYDALEIFSNKFLFPEPNIEWVNFLDLARKYRQIVDRCNVHVV